MTNEQMIAWARFPSTPNADFNAAGYYAAMERLIWIAQREALKSAWAEIEQLARMQGDVQELMSYPGGLRSRPTDEDYLAAMGPCGK